MCKNKFWGIEDINSKLINAYHSVRPISLVENATIYGGGRKEFRYCVSSRKGNNKALIVSTST